jgi:rhodanese-related sulfurtransferase
MTVVDTSTSAISRLLEQSRRGLDRVDPRDLAAVAAAGALVVDTRPVEQRERYGELPGAVVVDRNVLEWRLDPSSPDRLPWADDPGRTVVIVCQQGYSSSLAAHTLQQLGLRNATDLAGGFEAWAALPTSGIASSRSRRRRRTVSERPGGG